jgi:hypothetical protein
MANWIPIQKLTGKPYPAISDEQKKWYEDPQSPVFQKYTFEAVKEHQTPAPSPLEAKAVEKK